MFLGVFQKDFFSDRLFFRDFVNLPRFGILGHWLKKNCHLSRLFSKSRQIRLFLKTDFASKKKSNLSRLWSKSRQIRLFLLEFKINWREFQFFLWKSRQIRLLSKSRQIRLWKNSQISKFFQKSRLWKKSRQIRLSQTHVKCSIFRFRQNFRKNSPKYPKISCRFEGNRNRAHESNFETQNPVLNCCEKIF